eukprot:scaffold42633_cov36-Phaeocystis_antarctica.AAC.2
MGLQSGTWGCSPNDVGLQLQRRGVAAPTAWGCSPNGVGLQPQRRGVAAPTAWGCSLYEVDEGHRLGAVR